jgi:hypothetical protein
MVRLIPIAHHMILWDRGTALLPRRNFLSGISLDEFDEK